MGVRVSEVLDTVMHTDSPTLDTQLKKFERSRLSSDPRTLGFED